MSFQGSLKELPLPDIIQLVSVSGKTGKFTLSRDADQQASHGTAVARASLRPGDLVFFRGSPGGMISHVGLYVGNGNMINAPQTGVGVRVDPVSRYPYYAGARRYLSR